jgi:hypothetical protein
MSVNPLQGAEMTFQRQLTAAAKAALVAGAVATAAFAPSSFAASYGDQDATVHAQPAQGGEMNLTELEQRVRDTRAISVFQKLALQREVNDLLSRFRNAHTGGHNEVSTLRRPYERLIASIQAQLGRDPKLASEISASREKIWSVLTDRTKFASL